MIYETAFIVKADTSEGEIAKIKAIVSECVEQVQGTILVSDDWGTKLFAQPLSGQNRGHYYYFMYKANGSINLEIERRLKINESVIRFIVVKLDVDSKEQDLVKGYKNPNHQGNDDERDQEKDRKLFSKKKSCWFSAKKTKPDWKDPYSYSWLVSEFGKISPARVTGLRPCFQRQANAAIKRGRNMGLISYVSNATASRT